MTLPQEPSKDMEMLQVGDRVRWKLQPFGMENIVLKGQVTERTTKGICINWDDNNWGKFDRSNKVIWNVELDRER
jgi:hypothetical protein